MAIVVRNTDPLIQGFVEEINAIIDDVGAGSAFHLDDGSEVIVTAANGDGTPAKAIALANNIRAVYQFHKADTLAHKAADTATLSAPKAKTLAEAITLANEIKADYATHRASTSWHYNADSTNTISADDANNQGTLDTLLNELKNDINAHMAGGGDYPMRRLIDA